jgi:hypothetical protein
MPLVDLKSNLSRGSQDDRDASFEPTKEEQAIDLAMSRTRSREKEVAQLRQSQTTPLINIYDTSPQEKSIPNSPPVNNLKKLILFKIINQLIRILHLNKVNHNNF